MFVHNVYFWADDLSEDERETFEDGLETLTEIDLVQEGFIGKPAGTDRDVVDNSYEYNLILKFKNEQDQEAYQNHPTHLEFVEDCQQYWTDVKVFDAIKMT